MKKFIFKFIYFFQISIIIYLSVLTAVKVNYIESIEKNKILILGDSQTEFINLPNALNHSIIGSPYFIHYAFVTKFQKQIQNKKIYLACNYHNFSELYENRLRNDSIMPGWKESNLNIANDYDLHLLNYENNFGVVEVLKGLNPFDFKKILRLTQNLNIDSNKENTRDFIKDTTRINDVIQRHWKNKEHKVRDYIQQKYLNFLIESLLANNNEVIFLKMPLTNYYESNVPTMYKNKIYGLSQKYRIKILDLQSNLKISHRYELFKDYGHLNLNGDKIVNDYLQRLEY
jgi:hypothetical protein